MISSNKKYFIIFNYKYEINFNFKKLSEK